MSMLLHKEQQLTGTYTVNVLEDTSDPSRMRGSEVECNEAGEPKKITEAASQFILKVWLKLCRGV